MIRYVRKHSKKLGLSPGSLVFTGEERAEPVLLTLFRYGPDIFEERTLADVDEFAEEFAKPGIKWLNVDGLQDTRIVDVLGKLLDVHPLVLEDIVSPGQRAKLEEYDRYQFILARMIGYHTERRELDSETVSFLVGPDYVISFQEHPGDVFTAVRERLRGGAGRLRKMGADYLVYALLDVIVDHYFLTLEAFGEEIEELEESVIDDPSPEAQRRIRMLRSHLVLVRRAVWPVREVLGSMTRNESPFVTAGVQVYLRDAYDHAVQVIDIVESLRDVVGGLMDLFMTSISNRMNDIMKVLTIMGTIFIPLTFVAGIYGMNFDHMPELHFVYGYPIAIGVMAATAVGLLIMFRRKGWI